MSAYINRIGDSSNYDSDIGICEQFVNVNKRRKDAIRIVHNYYINQLEIYWQRCKNFITSATVSDLERYPLNTFVVHRNRFTTVVDLNRDKINEDLAIRIEDLKSKIEYYETNFYQALRDLNTNFTLDFELDLCNITRLFEQIANLLCLNDTLANPELPAVTFELVSKRSQSCGDFDKRISSTKYTPFILANDTGLFGLNSYLYAYFEHIVLIGIPDQPMSFDLRLDCPGLFLIHDFTHAQRMDQVNTKRIQRRHYSYSTLRPVYYRILEHDSKLYKELCILNMWSIIHEFSIILNIMDSFSLDYDTSPKTYISVIIRESYINLMVEFFSEYRRFTDLIVMTDHISTLIEVIKTLPPDCVKYLIETYRKIEDHTETPRFDFSPSLADLISAIESNATTEDIILNQIALHLITQWAGWKEVQKYIKFR